jgi:hypothetical protein
MLVGIRIRCQIINFHRNLMIERFGAQSKIKNIRPLLSLIINHNFINFWRPFRSCARGVCLLAPSSMSWLWILAQEHNLYTCIYVLSVIIIKHFIYWNYNNISALTVYKKHRFKYTYAVVMPNTFFNHWIFTVV